MKGEVVGFWIFAEELSKSVYREVGSCGNYHINREMRWGIVVGIVAASS